MLANFDAPSARTASRTPDRRQHAAAGPHAAQRPGRSSRRPACSPGRCSPAGRAETRHGSTCSIERALARARAKANERDRCSVPRRHAARVLRAPTRTTPGSSLRVGLCARSPKAIDQPELAAWTDGLPRGPEPPRDHHEVLKPMKPMPDRPRQHLQPRINRRAFLGAARRYGPRRPRAGRALDFAPDGSPASRHARLRAMRGACVNPPHLPVKAKRVIHLCMAGGPSQFETLRLQARAEASSTASRSPSRSPRASSSPSSRTPSSTPAGRSSSSSKHGQSGQEISDLFPHIAGDRRRHLHRPVDGRPSRSTTTRPRRS